MDTGKWLNGKVVPGVKPAVVKGVPAFISADTGFGMQKGHDADSEFIAAELKGEDGREFGIMLHMMCMNTKKTADSAYPMALSILSMTDFTDNSYSFREDAFRLPDFSQGTGDMDVETPVSGMKGNKDHIEAWAELPENRGRLHLYFQHRGPVLYNCSTGLFPFFDELGKTGQFSLPYLEGKGTLRLGDRLIELSGRAWLDRQWVNAIPAFYSRNFKWKWMNLQLDNGYRISLWDVIVNRGEEHAWATILSPKGAHTVVDMVPLSEGESDFYAGKTGQVYPTRYHIEFPSIDSSFDVKVRGPLGQEIISAMGEDKYEAACTFTGTFLGQNVSGTNYVELVGSFR